MQKYVSEVEGGSIIWVEVRVGHLVTVIQSVMAKIGIDTKRFKGNFLFPLLCAGLVPEDDLI